MPTNFNEAQKHKLFLLEHLKALCRSIKQNLFNSLSIRENPFLIHRTDSQRSLLKEVLLLPDFDDVHPPTGSRHFIGEQDGKIFLMKLVSDDLSDSFVYLPSEDDLKFVLELYEGLGILSQALEFRIPKKVVAKYHNEHQRAFSLTGANVLMLAADNNPYFSAWRLKIICDAYDRVFTQQNSSILHHSWSVTMTAEDDKNILMMMLQNNRLDIKKLMVILSGLAKTNLLKKLLESREGYKGTRNAGRNPLMVAATSAINIECMCLLIASHESLALFKKVSSDKWALGNKTALQIAEYKCAYSNDVVLELLRLGAEKGYKQAMKYWRDFDVQRRVPVNDRVTRMSVGPKESVSCCVLQ